MRIVNPVQSTILVIFYVVPIGLHINILITGFVNQRWPHDGSTTKEGRYSRLLVRAEDDVEIRSLLSVKFFDLDFF